MAGEWKPLRLGSVCTKIGSGATPRGGGDVYMDAGPYALIRSQNVYNNGFHREGLAYIGERHAAELANVEVLKGDVLLNITGDSVARACQVDPGVLPARVNQHVAIIRPEPATLDPRFLRYFLVSPEMQSKLLSWAGSGGTRNALTKGMIESFDVPAPEGVEEQRAIAHILGTLDDKIELNRRMSETLEGMARSLFQSWFVDFDPVRAKAEGRDPGLPKAIADLFPNRFADSELGEIPGGWDVGRFADVVEHRRNPENPLESPDALFQHFSIPAFDDGRCPKIERGEDIRSLKSRVPPGSILLSKLNPEIERVWLADVGGDDRAVCSTEFLVLLPRPPITRAYVYCLARSPVFRQKIEGLVTGTSKSHQRAHAEAILDLEVLRPPAPVANAFDKIALVLLGRTLGYRCESRMLAALRDTLLPKLISGELRLSDVERLLEAAP
ncbi:MAG: restriction endonuclease subunit S [Planctomycetota bacterium]